MENTNKVVLLGITSFVLVLTLNYFRKKRNTVSSNDKQLKEGEPVKTVSFGQSEVIEESVNLVKQDVEALEPEVLDAVEEVITPIASVIENSSANEVIVSCAGGEQESVVEKDDCDISCLEEQIVEEAIIEAKSNELKALVEQLAVKESKMSAPEVKRSENLNNNGPSEELSKLVEDMKLREKAVTTIDVNKATSERDSANNSPADFSTTNGSIHSDAHSESSADGNDSGKGGSDIHVSNGDASDILPVSPPSTPLITTERIVVYEFLLPQKLCGVLIGRFGSNVNDIKTRTGASLLIKKHPTQRKFKICAIEGTKTEIDRALEIIRDKFPSNKYPQVTLEQVNIPAASAVALIPETLQLTLPPEVSCDVIVSNIVSTNHLFVQQPTHPTYPSLPRLDACMAACYSQLDAPEVVRPVQEHLICAAPVYGGWYRARVMSNEETGSEEVDVSLVDYGGYARLPASSLKQIRVDFMSLPFQASECYLANIGPADESGLWSVESCAVMEQLCQGWVLQAQVVGYAPQGTPLVYLYRTEGDEVLFINRELVNKGVARWYEVDAEENVIAKDKLE